MTKPIYKLFIGKMSEAWHQLAPEEQELMMTRVDGILDQVGGKRILVCDSGWSSEEYPFFGVEEFTDIEAVQKYSELLDELNWGRYIESMSLLGTP